MGKKRPKTFNQAAAPLSEAEQALTGWGIAYTTEPGGKIVVEGDLSIKGKKLEVLPDLSGVIVRGSFDCSFNKLTTLKGAPCEVSGDFVCYTNRLTTLEGAPRKVGGSFQCGRNGLSTLKYAPEEVGGSFSCGRNKLTSLEHGPRIVNMNYSCGDNMLPSLEHAPAAVKGDFWCKGNPLVSFEHAPAAFGKLVTDAGDFTNWDEVPEKYRYSPATRAAREEASVIAATVLSRPLSVRRPLSLRRQLLQA
ncbi:MAG: hypothetical protein ACAH83_16965 [Alphaproteobacteria bacterium]